jgi:hypothetical protein
MTKKQLAVAISNGPNDDPALVQIGRMCGSRKQYATKDFDVVLYARQWNNGGRKRPRIEYVTWIECTSDFSRNWGHYFLSLADARKDFGKRCIQYCCS